MSAHDAAIGGTVRAIERKADRPRPRGGASERAVDPAAIARWRRRAVAASAALALVWAFGVDEAKSPAAWGTAGCLLGAAGICVAMARRRRTGPPWRLCAAAFVVLAADDYVLGVHDDVRREIREVLELGMGRVGAVLVAGAVLVLAVVAFVRWFVVRLPRRTAMQAGLGFAIATFGAGVLDVLGGRITAWIGRGSDLHRLNVVAEESLELLGVALVLLALVELRGTDAGGPGPAVETGTTTEEAASPGEPEP